MKRGALFIREAALSPQRQLTLMRHIYLMAMEGSQFIIATHSPILLGLPGAQILNFSEEGIQPIPYSDINVRDTSLREALKSPLFLALRDGGLLNDDHKGGCVLYEKQAQVELLLKEAKRQVQEIVFAHEHVRQMHGFYLLKDQKTMRFDIVISFDANDRRAVYAEVLADVQRAFPDYELQVAMDTDFTEE